ncbi:MAG: aminodeoxychorismate lyase [bacterium]|nr:aminodeoxychorismate lyase [bacterium]
MRRKNDTTEEAVKIGLGVLHTVSRIAFWVLVVMLLYAGAVRGYRFGYEIFNSTAVSEAPGVEKQITIPEKPAMTSVAKILKDKGLIQDEMVFMVQYWLFDCEPVPGTYTLNTSMTGREIIQYLNKAGKSDDSE